MNWSRLTRRGLVALAVIPASVASAQPLNLHGVAGWIETPHAYPLADGTLSLSLSRAYPNTVLSFGAQVLPRVFVAARYTSVSGRDFGPGVESQSYKDKGFDLVLNAVEESSFMPAISVGLLDVGGTALFASEYVVASKSTGPWTASLGLGWGRMGRAGDLSNPLGAVADRFDEPREAFDPDSSSGGEVVWENWFSGPDTAVFGSIAWHSPTRRLSLFAEWEGNTYDEGIARPDLTDEEVSRHRVRQSTRFNAGLRYKLLRNVDVGLAYVRGNTVAASIRLHESFKSHRLSANPPLPSMRIPSVLQAGGRNAWTTALARNDIYPLALTQDEPAQTTVFAVMDRQADFVNNATAVARITHSAFPESADVKVIEVAGGMPIRSIRIAAAEVDDARQPGAADPVLAATSQSLGATQERSVPLHADSRIAQYPAWTWELSPALRSNIGGAGGFFLTDVQLKPAVKLQLNPTLTLSGVGALRIVGNLDDAQTGPPSALPPVRSNLELYQTNNRSAYIDSLEVTAFRKLGSNLYSRASAGILEEMFTGLHSEVLYAPQPSSWAIGVEAAQVWQRHFDQLLELQSYQTWTAHLNAYWNTGWNGVRIAASAGRYLARDVGVTLDVSRETRSGFVVGVFATKTNVSAADFGEGSFDKGLYFRIPLSAMDARAGSGSVSFDYRFLSRDGGQKLRINRQLVNVIDAPFSDPLRR